ncbi:hypothetical protein Naga_100841g1, partial [Nannochloropsis gaditana]
MPRLPSRRPPREKEDSTPPSTAPQLLYDPASGNLVAPSAAKSRTASSDRRSDNRHRDRHGSPRPAPEVSSLAGATRRPSSHSGRQRSRQEDRQLLREEKREHPQQEHANEQEGRRAGRWPLQLRGVLEQAESELDSRAVGICLDRALEMIESRAQRAKTERDARKTGAAAEGARALVDTCVRLVRPAGEATSLGVDLVCVVVPVLRRLGDSAHPGLSAALDARFAEVVKALLVWAREAAGEAVGACMAVEEALQAWGVGSGDLSLWGRHLPLARSLLQDILEEVQDLGSEGSA